MALEGFMLAAAFSAVVGTFFFESTAAGLAMALVGSGLLALVFSFAVLKMQAHVIVLGTALNLLATGATQYLVSRMYDSGYYRGMYLVGLPNINLPVIHQTPVLGEILSGHSVVVYLTWLLAIAAHVLLYRQVLGLRIRAVGENPEAAMTVGINVPTIRFVAIMLSGVLCGLAGAQLSMGNVRLFVENMTAGRGFIALVAVLFAREKPLGVLAASLLFGFTDALSMRLQAAHVVPQFIMMIPYVATMVALFATRGRVAALVGEGTREAEEAEKKSG
jgi:simple sugar transport system permease protein